MTSLTITIEIPRGSNNKYEVDHESGRIRLDRALFTPMTYPTDYGFIEDSLGEDGDPLDALVLLQNPVFPGVMVDARPVGVFKMSDEAGPDAKIITVPATDPRYQHIQGIDDVPHDLRNQIEHFFTHYKDLEPGKHTSINGWGDLAEAQTLIDDAYRRLANEHS
ncbi:inorganic diphosphatase [Cryobacterium algoricola]|uniref:Inorganic pyrophosphatase n=1 Tax=Cryobacterium algoricola TaxID=1259183 RepID=A0ABY2IED7_9MICO|nr:inorganic diphosphatase [Cryobacterium algoricola]TFB86860.1 inorganic diphosphatase [Cryobacterium algoricola]